VNTRRAIDFIRGGVTVSYRAGIRVGEGGGGGRRRRHCLVGMLLPLRWHNRN